MAGPKSAHAVQVLEVCLDLRQSTRVDTIRSLLERYLSDDADLAELHLSGQRCAPCDTSSPGSTSIPLRLRLATWVDAGA